MNKRLLTLDDLVKFCEDGNLSNFSSKEKGYALSVSVPASFESDYNPQDGLVKLKFRIIHTLKNRNSSYVSKESMEEAKASLPYRPILASVRKLDDGTYDFGSHDIAEFEDENGEIQQEYIEQPIGTFTNEETWYEPDEDGKEFLCGYGVIPIQYTHAYEALQARGDKTKCSAELSISKMSYDAKEKCLSLDQFTISGVTLLGSRDNYDGSTTDIQEGMKNARAEIVDFSAKNNSVFNYADNSKLIEAINRLNETISCFNINATVDDSTEKGVKANVNHFEELLAKYGKAAEDVEFDYSSMSDDELDAKFAEVFGEAAEAAPSTEDPTTDEGEGTTEGTEHINDGAEGAEPENTEPETTEDEPVVAEEMSIKMSDGSVKTFSLTLNDIQAALCNLVNDTYGESDDVWYSVTVYPDDNKLVMYDWWTEGNAYRQSYERVDDKFSLVGERVKVHAAWLSDEEQAVVDSMKSNYAVMESKVAKYEKAEEDAKKSELMNSECYAVISETAEVKAIADDKAAFDTMSSAELENKLNNILLKYAKEGKLNFANVAERKPVSAHNFGTPKARANKSKYGSIFD